MRISDWSSDVCSSDLEALPFPVDAHAVHDPDTLDDIIKAALAKKPDLMILGGGDGTISGLVDHLVGTGTALGVLPLGTANSFRSEEHTSELQSLMRISYAVFCLKKKKNNKQKL